MKACLSIILFSFLFLSKSVGQEILLLKTSGKVVIGDTTLITTPGNYNLYVQNGILTERVKVALRDASEWSDDSFMFTPTIEDVNTCIEENQHLVNMPSAAQLVKDGYELKDMDAKLLEQIEWLWQHTIQLSEENKALKDRLEALEARIEKK